MKYEHTFVYIFGNRTFSEKKRRGRDIRKKNVPKIGGPKMAKAICWRRTYTIRYPYIVEYKYIYYINSGCGKIFSLCVNMG